MSSEEGTSFGALYDSTLYSKSQTTTTHSTPTPDTTRLILHADMDAFYAQVESIRLSLPHSVPLAVRQWNRVIAVNYAARPLGVKRQMHVQRDILALEKGDEVRVPHVPTYDINDCARLNDFELDDSEAMDEGVEVKIYKHHDEIGARDKPPPQDTNKVCLDPYRHASQQVWRNIIRTLRELSTFKDGNDKELFMLERASIDEAYIDITDLVANCDLSSIIKDSDEFIGHPASIPDETHQTFVEADRNIMLASHVAKHIRNTLTSTLGYTISIGIAHNKTIAKLASAMHKPDQQTYVLAGMVPSVMQKVPFEKLRFLGGKLGQAVIHGDEEGRRVRMRRGKKNNHIH